jgi:hypothetical protein
LLPSLPGNFHLLHQDAGSDSDIGLVRFFTSSLSAMAAGAVRSTAQFEGVADCNRHCGNASDRRAL